MVKTLILSTSLLSGMASLNPVSAQQSKGPNPAARPEVKFLENISIDLAPATISLIETPAKQTAAIAYHNAPGPEASIEHASELQLKFAILLDAEVEQITINSLYGAINEWWGTRYQYGGNSKDGIDCSALMQAILNNGTVSLPRTAKEQYDVTHRINRGELVEGDLVFFNTRGGVSHVGVYLQNNKFAHAATSGGVMISDLDEAYWAKKYIGAGRITKEEVLLTAL
jgi:murein DD-endopeptidase / murein LD-carboxypeptidase